MGIPSTKMQTQAIKMYQKIEKKAPNWALVREYLPLLKSIASKMAINFPTTADRESIYTIGLLGLISASQSFDKLKNYNFGTYAAIRIKGALLDELRRLDWLPRNVRCDIKAFKQKLVQCEQSLGRPLTDEEICNYLHVSTTKSKKISEPSKPYVFIPLELNYGEEEERRTSSLEEKFEDLNQDTSFEACERSELKEIIKEKLKDLSKMEQQVLALHYVEGLYLSEISRVFKVSESRICQVHTEAIKKLRRYIKKFFKE